MHIYPDVSGVLSISIAVVNQGFRGGSNRMQYVNNMAIKLMTVLNCAVQGLMHSTARDLVLPHFLVLLE